MATIEERVARVEVKVDTFRNDVRELKEMIAALDRKFLWVMGAQFTTLLAIIAASFGVLTKLL